jgi:CBS domain-containing protein
VHTFLDVFCDIGRLLKTRLALHPDDTRGVRELMRRDEAQNPYWVTDARDLGHFRVIRNVLTHERGQEYGYPVLVTKRSQERLVGIKQGLQNPVPISRRHKKDVVHVTPSGPLASVLALAYEKQFSPFPVVEAGIFRGLITENEITRWLGRQVAKGRTTIDLAQVEVRAVLREKETDRKGILIFRFVALDVPEAEVMSLFVKRPMLEVVLLTKTGTRDSPIAGGTARPRTRIGRRPATGGQAPARTAFGKAQGCRRRVRTAAVAHHRSAGAHQHQPPRANSASNMQPASTTRHSPTKPSRRSSAWQISAD